MLHKYACTRVAVAQYYVHMRVNYTTATHSVASNVLFCECVTNFTAVNKVSGAMKTGLPMAAPLQNTNSKSVASP
jgi:hypothetical protein